jgi:hypothetical protein
MELRSSSTDFSPLKATGSPPEKEIFSGAFLKNGSFIFSSIVTLSCKVNYQRQKPKQEHDKDCENQWRCHIG